MITPITSSIVKDHRQYRMSFIDELENYWANLPEGGYTIIEATTVDGDCFTSIFTLAKCPTLEQARHALITKVIARYSKFIDIFSEEIYIVVDDDNDTFTLLGYNDFISDELKNTFDAFMSKNTLTAEEFKNFIKVIDDIEDYLIEKNYDAFLIR